MKKTISYNHPEFQRIRLETQEGFETDFNFIQHDVVKKVFDNMDFEQVVEPSFKTIMKECFNDLAEMEDWVKEFFEEEGRETKGLDIQDPEFEGFCEWVKDNKYDEVMEHWQHYEHYPMWSTLFEARDGFLSDKLLNCVDELYEIGIGVMEGGDYFNTLLFINGAGYDFYEAHWIPLYTRVLGCINTNSKKA